VIKHGEKKSILQFHFGKRRNARSAIRNMGVIEGNEPVSLNRWKSKRAGEAAVKRWMTTICITVPVCVLVGTQTAQRRG